MKSPARPNAFSFSHLCALGAFCAAASPAMAMIDDDELPSLLGHFETGSEAISLAANAPAISLVSYPRAGWQATLSTRAHGVRGTVTIVDADTFRVDNFFYDGGGINVHFILAAADDYNTFSTDRIVTDLNLLGMPHNGDSITIDLPPARRSTATMRSRCGAFPRRRISVRARL